MKVLTHDAVIGVNWTVNVSISGEPQSVQYFHFRNSLQGLCDKLTFYPSVNRNRRNRIINKNIINFKIVICFEIT